MLYMRYGYFYHENITKRRTIIAAHPTWIECHTETHAGYGSLEVKFEVVAAPL